MQWKYVRMLRDARAQGAALSAHTRDRASLAAVLSTQAALR
jgi:hypothetical protein